MSIIVPGYGPQPCDVLLVGEAPGVNEAKQGRPFVGRAGEEQERYLARYELTTRKWRLANVIQEYTEGNPDPTSEQIAYWTPRLLAEVRKTRPKLIVAVGRFAMRWFLGEDADLDTCYGLPHRAGAFDPSRADRACGAVVVPTVHPAAGFYDNDARAVIQRGYEQVAMVLRAIKAGRKIGYREDEYEGMEEYDDITGTELALGLSVETSDVLSLDTEGDSDDPWSIQLSTNPGHGSVLRCSQADFSVGVRAIQYLADQGTPIVLHNAMYDLAVCRAAGLELRDAKLWDTMYAAYLLRLEPQGLKALAWRWCGMRMSSYRETVGDAGRDKQIEYLVPIAARDWPKPEPRIVASNDGTVKLYQPQSIGKRAAKILSDLATGKVDKDGEPVDPLARWRMVDREMREEAEREYGPMPVGGLGDIPLDQAVRYAARDADATLRLHTRLKVALADHGLTQLMADGMEILPVFEEMQATGMPASRPHFEALAEHCSSEMARLQSRISSQYYQGRPFNPGSSKHVASLMRRRGLKGVKLTPGGDVSTAKKSIEHLRYTDPAMADVFEWREAQHVKDSFCDPVLDRIPDGVETYPVRCTLKVTRTATRRLASTDPNLLAIPVRKELGRRVRDCYRCEEGELLGAWDLSQIEMRVAAHESADPLLCRLFHEGRDIHSETAAAIFGIPLDQVDKMKHRLPAKNAGFGTLYGIGGDGLLTQLRMLGIEGWDERRCERLIREWLKLYSGVNDYIKRVQAETYKTGMVRDRWDMPRYLPGIWSNDKKVAAEAGRIAVNHKIQGGAQGMIQRSIIWMKPRVREMQLAGLKVNWSQEIHDEIVLWFDADLWEALDGLAMEALTEHCGMRLRVPVEAEGHKGRTWAELK